MIGDFGADLALLIGRYPAGFIYFYSVLYYLTEQGKNIRTAQYIFAGIYVATLALVYRIYARCNSVRGVLV